MTNSYVYISITGMLFVMDSNMISVYQSGTFEEPADALKKKRFLFEFKCPDSKYAKAVMDSMYYGEYTGG